MIAIQLGLPLPRPERAEPWPNNLGFDIEIGGVQVEVMDTLINAATAVVDGEDLYRGTGENWLRALSNLELVELGS